MNLSLEAYDWWATQIPTQYRTLETKTLDSSNSELIKSYHKINDDNADNLFEEYIKVRVLPCFLVKQPLLNVGIWTSPSSSAIAFKTLMRKNAMEFIRRSLRIFVTLAMPTLNLFDVQ